MPGCLGLDALWQMLGFFLGWLGSPGKGRALGMGEVKFSGQVLPTMKKVVYGIDLKRVMRSKLVLGIADGWLEADGTGDLPGQRPQGRRCSATRCSPARRDRVRRASCAGAPLREGLRRAKCSRRDDRRRA